MKKLWDRVPALWRIPALAGVALLAFVLLSFVWAGAWNGVGNWWYHHSENDAKREISGIKATVANETAVANKAVAAYVESKAAYEEEKKRHDIATQLLEDRSKTTNQRVEAYEAAVAARPTVTGPESDAELCQRARALGISVRCD